MEEKKPITKLLDYRLDLPVIFAFLILIVIATYGFMRDRNFTYTIELPDSLTKNQLAFAFGSQPSMSQPDFFNNVKKQFIDNDADFIEADLSAMHLKVYKGGNLALDVPILTKGKEGSWWETPAGLYKINSKEQNHFSSIGHVYMPWSMNFQGNFYIHGETYYPNGTAVSSSFTGGCIKLRTFDAKRVYNLINQGTPLLVYEQSFQSDDFAYDGPTLNAPIYMAADLKSNHVFTNKQSTTEVPIASLTKLMTALIATEYINLDNIATVPKSAIIYTSKPRLQPGDEFSVYQLLFPLLMESSNEAAETIARFYGRDAFIAHMNTKAKAIGMAHTIFEDPSGVGAGNVSSAEDLFMLAKYIYNNRSFIFSITSGKLLASAYGRIEFKDITNLNDFTDMPNFFGGKNGKSTAASETNLSVFEFPVDGKPSRPVVYIVLNSPTEKADTERLITYTLGNFK